MIAAGLFAPGALAQTPPAASVAEGQSLFQARCKSCHEPAIERAPNRGELATRPAEGMKAALTTGVMAPMAAGLSPEQIDSIVAYLKAPPATAGDAPPAGQPARRQPVAATPTVDKMCEANPPISAAKGDWPMVGYNSGNTRFQPTPGLTVADVKRLKVKWSFTVPAVGNSQPIVIGDWLWILSRGKMYALDANSGCVRYKVDGVNARNSSPVIQSKLSPSGWLLVVGQGDRTVKAFDAQTGKEIWVSERLESHPASGITGSPVIVGDQVFVPLTSGEEVASNAPNYPCCTFRGSLAALDLSTGKTQWKTYVITEELKPIRKNSAGAQMQGPAGAAIWSAPTVDAKRGLVYVATGDSYTEAETKGADAIVAIDMKTGAIRWNSQVTANDNFIVNCTGAKTAINCPAPLGPDYDFGASPILMKVAAGKGAAKEVLVSGQKSGIVYGMNPNTGKVLWKRQIGNGSALGGIEWGIAADPKTIYAPNSDIVNMYDAYARAHGSDNSLFKEKQPPAKPGLAAIDPATGKVRWHIVPPAAPCQFRGDRTRSDRFPGACFNALSAAPAVMPGVVFEGATDGWFRAYDAATGKVLWEDSTTSRTYATANGVPEQPGGSIDGNGPTIANGKVYVVSGHDGAGGTGGNGSNVLLAYTVDGK